MPDKTTQDQEPSEDSGSSDTQEPEYKFDGYTVEFSEKVKLTPVVSK